MSGKAGRKVSQKANKQVTTSELLLHPVRWRIVQALMGRRLTTAELGARLPDVATTTLYRQVALLVERDVVIIVDENRVRGAVQRTYALGEPQPVGADEPLAVDDHRQVFAQFVATLVSDFDRYLARESADPVADNVTYSQAAIHVTDAELAELGRRMGELLEPLLAERTDRPRRRLLFSTVLLPDAAEQG